MALFGKADADIPLVNQAAQVDVSNHDELKKFWLRVMAHATDASARDFIERIGLEEYRISAQRIKESAAERFDQLSVLVQGEGRGGRAFVPLSNEGALPAVLGETSADYDLRRLAALCTDIREVLEGLSRPHPVLKTGIVQRIRARTLSMGPPRIMYLCANPELNEKVGTLIDESISRKEKRPLVSLQDMPEEVPLEWLSPYNTIVPIIPDIELGAELESRLIDIWWRRAAVSICPECENPFVSYRKDQRWCSHRCTNRFSQRKRYREARDSVGKKSTGEV